MLNLGKFSENFLGKFQTDCPLLYLPVDTGSILVRSGQKLARIGWMFVHIGQKLGVTGWTLVHIG